MPELLIITTDPKGGKNGYSNGSPHGFRLDGVRWPTVAHYLLAQRFAGTPLADDIRSAPSAEAARVLARDAGQATRPDWAEVRDGLLEKALLAKFRAHPTLRAGLLATGDRHLVEEPHFPPGATTLVSRNRLGFALMRVRTTLRRSEAQKRRRTRPAPDADGPQ